MRSFPTLLLVLTMGSAAIMVTAPSVSAVAGAKKKAEKKCNADGNECKKGEKDCKPENCK